MASLQRHTSPLLSFAITVLKAVITYPIRVAKARRVMGQVTGMSEYELSDIGLTRQDLWDASALPLGTDPGRLFQARVHERLQARLDRKAELAAHAPTDASELPRRGLLTMPPSRPPKGIVEQSFAFRQRAGLPDFSPR
jgi:uncharacterized protein YjiS (DUF1127 family)